MKKSFLKFKILALVITIGTLLSPIFLNVVLAQGAEPEPPSCTTDSAGNEIPGWTSKSVGDTDAGFTTICVPAGESEEFDNANSQGELAKKAVLGSVMAIIAKALNAIGSVVMRLVALILVLISLLFDTILNYTIVHMSENMSSGGIGDSINSAWGTLRDIANLAFIFVLLWTAIQTILDLNTSRFATQIRNIILVALLINFSLFFAKIVIDASNIITIGFYNAIVLGGNSAPITTIPGFSEGIGGFSAIFMKAVGIQSFFGFDILNGLKSSAEADIMSFLNYIFGSITMLVLAVVLLVTTVMFITRFVLLVFLLILSPAALIGIVIPGLNGWFNKWKDALLNQAFFAPYFMLLIWIAIKIIASPTFLNTGGVEFSNIAVSVTTVVGLFVKFSLVIGFIVTALIVAKSLASKTMGFNYITSGVGAGGAGSAAWLGRKTLGRIGKNLSERTDLQVAAGTQKGWRGAGARLALYTSKKVGSGTFDARNAKIPTNTIGDTIQGTIGRTKVGKALGLNDVNIASVPLAATIIGNSLGAPGTKGYKETKAESDKRVRDREAAQASELALAQAKKAIKEGAAAVPGSATFTTQIDAMEKALAKLSDKETETLVASNDDLLKSQNFANAISVKQLEALNKSDKFTDTEKSILKNNRFSDINATMASLPIGGSVPVGKVKDKIKSLSDTELEMIDSVHLADPRFVAELKSGQIDAINKSNKFTAAQKDTVKAAKMKPLIDALTAGNTAIIQSQIRKVDPKTLVGYMSVPGRGGVNIALDKDVLPTYTPQILKRMAQEMNNADIQVLRTALLAGTPPLGGSVATRAWLIHPNKGLIEFN